MKNSNKGLTPIAIILIVAGILALGGGGWYAYEKIANPPAQAPGVNRNNGTSTSTQTSRQGNTQPTESQILAVLNNDWPSIQALIPFRPALGQGTASNWNKPVSVQFIGKGNLFIEIEDDYNPYILLMNFNGSQFSILKTFSKIESFSQNDWNKYVKEYGDFSSVSTYTLSVVRNGEIVSYPQLTKVPENIFVSSNAGKNVPINWKTYKNEQYGFEVEYPYDSSQGEGVDEWFLWLNPENEKKGYVAVSVADEPSVLLSGTYGGRYLFSRFPEAPALRNRVLSEEKIINSYRFAKEYWIAYGGMGSWDTVINVYTKRNNKYYILSLIDNFAAGTPGETNLLETQILAAMQNSNNQSVKLFDQILSTFKFTK